MAEAIASINGWSPWRRGPNSRSIFLAVHARLVVFDERVVQLAARWYAVALRLASLEGQLLVEPRGKVAERVRRSRPLPRLHRQRTRLADLGHQRRGELARAIVVAADLAQIRRDCRIGRERRVGLARADQVTDGAVGGFLVNQGRDDGQFVGPESRRAGGHHRFLVPSQQLADRGQRRRLAQPAGQIHVVFAHGVASISLCIGYSLPYSGSSWTPHCNSGRRAGRAAWSHAEVVAAKRSEQAGWSPHVGCSRIGLARTVARTIGGEGSTVSMIAVMRREHI